MNVRLFHFLWATTTCLTAFPAVVEAVPSSADEVRPFLEKYCLECHGGEKVKGKIDFPKILASEETLEAQFETWQTVREVLEFEDMPPEEELQPGDSEREKFLAWYREHFVDSVEAKPGQFQPRRLSAIEYRNTLWSLFGFDLEVAIIEAEQTVAEKSLVMKLMPTDPPGASGFTNDTHGNPLTTVIWDQYAFLADAALNELFSRKRRAELESMAGTVPESGLSSENVDRLVQWFLQLAWRRDVSEEKKTEILAALGGLEGKALVAELKRELKTVLMAPAFIYRGLLMEGAPGKQASVDRFELAERLSYFLWADMPDSELSDRAAVDALSDPETFRVQVERMLDSPKSRRLAEVFAAQWLSLDEIGKTSNKVPVADALHSQPIDFVDYLFRENRPLIELVDSEVTFVNPHTSKFYPKDRGKMTKYVKQKGIEVESVPNQKLTLEHADERGGILTMPGVLAMNKGPVIRGTWVLERILGDHLSDPPPDVGQVAPNRKGEDLSFRERFEQHRSSEACALCHDKIDPIGFALQGYNDAGAYILKPETAAAAEKKKKKQKTPPMKPVEKIDTSGQLPSGESFADFKELKELLVTSQRSVIIRNIVERTLSYALCRKLEIYDQPTIDAIAAKLEANDGTYRDLVHEVVNSLPFREATFPAEES